MNIKIPDTVLSTELNNEAVLLQLETGEYFGLNEVGMAFWRLISAGQSVEAARTALLADYDVSDTTLTRDLDTLVQQLLARKLVSVNDAA